MDQETKHNRKRPRDGSDYDSPESKFTKVESVTSSPDLGESRLDSVNSSIDDNLIKSNSSAINSPDAKRIQDHLLNILDEADDPSIQDLDSVMKRFEEEITGPVPFPATANENHFVVESQPELGYLLEASDDELGLPPTFSGNEKSSTVDLATETRGSGDAGFSQIIGFEDEIPSYDSFEFGLAGDSGGSSYNDNGDFVALGGLFDYSDEKDTPAGEIAGVQWLSAL